NSPYFSGINPYALGFAMFRDIKRICALVNGANRLVRMQAPIEKYPLSMIIRYLKSGVKNPSHKTRH
ncbi:hypothetical protein ABJZ23_13735, partial [Vibrio parahaemolyticus]